MNSIVEKVGKTLDEKRKWKYRKQKQGGFRVETNSIRIFWILNKMNRIRGLFGKFHSASLLQNCIENKKPHKERWWVVVMVVYIEQKDFKWIEKLWKKGGKMRAKKKELKCKKKLRNKCFKIDTLKVKTVHFVYCYHFRAILLSFYIPLMTII